MIGLTKQQVTKARSKTERLLAFFLMFSVIYGLYFAQGWFFLAFALSLYTLKSYPSRRIKSLLKLKVTASSTDVLFLSMILCSALGLIYPIRVKDGLIEVIRWGILWYIFRLGGRISEDELAKERLAQWIVFIGLAVAFWGWLPWAGKIGGRLSSVFGYSNATAVFLGAALLLCLNRKAVKLFLGISLLCTGSRAGVGLLLIVYLGQQVLSWIEQGYLYSFFGQQRPRRTGTLPRLSVKIGAMFLGIVGLILMAFRYRSAWENLITWGFSSTSWLERLAYYQDGLRMAWYFRGFPRAGGWMAFPTVQHVPYWTSDPHSGFINVLLNQGIWGIISIGIWGGFTLYDFLKNRGKRIQRHNSPRELQKASIEDRLWMVLIFLMAHSLIDADFSFGALGCLFWMLFGCLQKNGSHTFVVSFERSTFGFNMLTKGILMLSLCMSLISGYALVNPSFLEREQAWNKLALQWLERDPAKSKVFWEQSLNWDQTQITILRKQAELSFRHEDTDNGLKHVEKALSWQPFDLEAYEWAQSLVWEAAEKKRSTQPEVAKRLYQWVENVPRRIEERMGRLNNYDRSLWKGYEEFRPSQHINLLAEYARQRQFTQPLPKT
ncbi:O-antigen ligase domain-containing protein [Desulfosporosinus sp. SB140]|uniref:O-antigen ligase domain-containing protein n=1 Tax=Desulfosporosinus paludis TaxID=3115649 RepID=UPI00388E859D